MPHDLLRLESLLKALDEAYDKKAWHGPNLKGALRGVSCETAAWRPAQDRHNIWEISLHAAYWKYAVLRSLTGGKRGSFEVVGSNWFRRPVERSVHTWKADLMLLEKYQRELKQAVAGLSDRELDRNPAGSKHSRLRLIQGIALHDVYHAGQIQLIKRLLPTSLRK
ncbi:MAG: DinB family protein [Terriglobia bacterium]